ncbi:hypothetical protein ZWY2020_021868 [Hordeum vulgare]|nr:hypothetical protein ZWY2020_021868 [Hordeum vulgare]
MSEVRVACRSFPRGYLHCRKGLKPFKCRSLSLGSQESNGVVGGNNGVEETFGGQNEGVQKGKVTLFGQDEQDQPEFEFRHESPDALGWKPSSPYGTSAGTPGAEFYDAFEEISSDGATRSSRCIDDEYREMRLSMLTEIEGRKQAEEVAETWQKEWKKLSHHLSLIALSLPSPTVAENDYDTSADTGAELCQQISVSRTEVESEMESVIAAKNFEIARLSDRVQYYEAANREMSQRNQEAIEMSRQQRNKRKIRQKWFWGSVGIAVTLGTAAIAWSYMPASQSQAGDSNGTNTNSD